MISEKRWQEALDIQNAVNLSGLVHDFPAVLNDVWAEAYEVGEGTNYVNTHPIVILWLDKLNSLAGIHCLCSTATKPVFAAYDTTHTALAEGKSRGFNTSTHT